jgi:hypothetical protein
MKTNESMTASKCPKPTVKDLASLAATLCNNVQVPPNQLAQLAFDLWMACDYELVRRNAENWQLEHEKEKAELIKATEAGISLQQDFQESQGHLKRPLAFDPTNSETDLIPPAEKRTSLRSALEALMPKVKSYTERMPKFKRYLADSMNCSFEDKRVIQQVEELQKNNVTEQWFDDIQPKFVLWFRRTQSESRQWAASKAAKKRHSKKI